MKYFHFFLRFSFACTFRSVRIPGGATDQTKPFNWFRVTHVHFETSVVPPLLCNIHVYVYMYACNKQICHTLSTATHIHMYICMHVTSWCHILCLLLLAYCIRLPTVWLNLARFGLAGPTQVVAVPLVIGNFRTFMLIQQPLQQQQNPLSSVWAITKKSHHLCSISSGLQNQKLCDRCWICFFSLLATLVKCP